MLFDRKKIKLQPLANRAHDLEVSCIMDLQSQSDSNLSTPIKDVAIGSTSHYNKKTVSAHKYSGIPARGFIQLILRPNNYAVIKI